MRNEKRSDGLISLICFWTQVDWAFDPVVKLHPKRQTKQVAKGQQEIDGFFSKLSQMKIADKLKERKVNEVEGERFS